MTLRDVYRRQAARFDRERNWERNGGADGAPDGTLVERAWLERFAALTPPGGRVLDLGCGSGRPIAQWLIGQGFDLTGVDFAPEMLALAAGRFPQARWIEADMRALALGVRFDGVIAWDSFFHLTADEQRAALPAIARHVGPGGALMLTVGPEAGTAWGTVAGEPVPHASLSPGEYAALLRQAGLEGVAFVPEDPTCGGHSVLLAKRG